MDVADPGVREARAPVPPARAPALPEPAPAAAPAPGRAARSSRRGGNTRAIQTLELVREKPGITIPEIAKAMKIRAQLPVPRAAAVGVRRSGQARRPGLASGRSSTSTHAASARNVRARRQARTAKTRRRRPHVVARGLAARGQTTSATNGRTATGATKASVLAALAGGDAMTAAKSRRRQGSRGRRCRPRCPSSPRPARSRRPSAATGSSPRLRAIGSDIPELRSRGPWYLTLRVSSTVVSLPTAAARGGMLLFGLRGDVEW